MGDAAQKGCSEHAFHVDHNVGLNCWDVVDEEGRVIGHRHQQREAIDLAIQQAQRAHGDRNDVVVCVEEADGHYTLAWSSH